MSRIPGILSAVVTLALTLFISSGKSHAEGMLIKFEYGIMCDESGQIEEIISQYGQKPLQEVLVAVNERTGKVSCGVVRNPVLLVMEPVRVIGTPAGRMLIVKLTAINGLIQYAWRPIGKTAGAEEEEAGA